ncbi:putative sporulation protein YyaC [Fontibacillus solani]|uniref:Putative sporulation protein YyaC n=1 Tax=Fontibacillus solani TaxID=1572857 RepID=A0A7W3SR98_9BACL|nr:spore protease YyaC [Fontibacillus solani]MBA9084795.1 putative sporulation protein YyaC [Fontibacillus solani]
MEDIIVLPASGFDRKKRTGSELADFFREVRGRHRGERFTFLCIGTDRSTGDALGPLVGSRLVEYGLSNVVGTLQYPCDADNLEKRTSEIPQGHIIIAIDACLGSSGSVGLYLVSGQPLIPAQSVGGSLPAVGHYSVAAVVNVNGPKPYWTLQMTSLYQVMKMAEEIACSITDGFKSDDLVENMVG